MERTDQEVATQHPEEVEFAVEIDKAQDFVCIDTGLYDRDGRSLIVCTEGGADRSGPSVSVFFTKALATSRGGRARCPIHKIRHDTMNILEAFQDGWINMDERSDGTELQIPWKDLLMLAIEPRRSQRKATS